MVVVVVVARCCLEKQMSLEAFTLRVRCARRAPAGCDLAPEAVEGARVRVGVWVAAKYLGVHLTRGVLSHHRAGHERLDEDVLLLFFFFSPRWGRRGGVRCEVWGG